MTESLQWHPVSERMPDLKEPVLLWYRHDSGTDWTAGWHDGERWRCCVDSYPMDYVTVTHWAQPKGPQ